MRKTIYTILLSLSFLTLFTTCKNPKIDYNTFSITEESIQPEKNKVLVSGKYDFLGEVMNMKLNIGRNEQLADAESHLMNLEDQSFSVTVEGLDPSISYYYCYVVEFDNHHKLLTDVGTFTTLSDKPVVRTLEVTATDTTAILVRCIVDEDYGMTITERGICWNHTGNPTIGDNLVTDQHDEIGEYTCKITGLDLNTPYFVRAYAKNDMGPSYGEILQYAFKKPTVETLPMDTNSFTQTSATCCGEIRNPGSSPVIQCGICWGVTPNPDVDGDYVPSDLNENNFCVTLTSLSPGTTYYYCAYAINNVGTGYGEIVPFTTLASNMFSIVVSCSPPEGGQVEGSGSFPEGGYHTVTAIANDHFEFDNWTEDGHIVYENADYTFKVERDRTLVAKFSLKKYTVSATSNPSNGGTVTGAGEFEYGSTCILTATANEYFEFDSWTDDNGNEISSQNIFPFEVTGDRVLVANFKALPQVPEGGIDALYSVSYLQKVYFSQGNLRYNAFNQRWSFAENQYEHVGVNNSCISPEYNGWIDLFGWGTGNNPTNTSTNNNDYVDFNDWGYNPIFNGGNTAGLWRTLTKQEWKYVFYDRPASTINGIANARYAKATVNNVKGIILFPDEYEHPSGINIESSVINNPNASFNNNTYIESQWLTLENKGCVFLPVTGWRDGRNIKDVDIIGYYWSASSNSNSAFGLRFNDSELNAEFGCIPFHGQCVRLVHPVR